MENEKSESGMRAWGLGFGLTNMLNAFNPHLKSIFEIYKLELGFFIIK